MHPLSWVDKRRRSQKPISNINVSNSIPICCYNAFKYDCCNDLWHSKNHARRLVSFCLNKRVKYLLYISDEMLIINLV